MKKLCALFISLLAVSVFAAAASAEEIEFLNEQMLKFAHEHMGKKIGRGECWDLAAEPLNALGADWDGNFKFGKKVASCSSSGLKLEPDMKLMPGDIIHFYSVKSSWSKTYPNGRSEWGSETLGMPDHVAILKEYDGKTVLTLLHQNVNGKRYMVETTTDLANVKSGTILIYRPWRSRGK